MEIIVLGLFLAIIILIITVVKLIDRVDTIENIIEMNNAANSVKYRILKSGIHKKITRLYEVIEGKK